MQIQNPFEEIAERLSRIEHCLIDIKSNKPGGVPIQPEADQLLNITQAADFLNLSIATLYTKVHKAELPVCKRSHRLYFSKQDLMEYVKAGRKKTGAELAAEAEQYVNDKKKGGKV